MNGLALYAGYGGLDIGLMLAEPGYRTVCYVEREASCAANLVARMAAAELHQAPVWDDSGTFDGRPWCGKVDIVTAGFPCPEVSIAGKRRGVHGERWLWDDVARIVREVAPWALLLENVRGLLSANDGYAMRSVLGDLAEMGFDAVWGSVPAGRLGAAHARDRIFIVAHASQPGRKGGGKAVTRPDGKQRTDMLDWAAEQWATPRVANNSMVGWPVKDARSRLEDQTAKWASPTSSEADKLSSGVRNTPSVTEQAKLWATPRAHEVGNYTRDRGNPDKERLSLTGMAADFHSRRRALLTTLPGAASSKARPRLSPSFTEWMMDLPKGWTDYECVETGFSRWLRHMRGALDALPLPPCMGRLPSRHSVEPNCLPGPRSLQRETLE
ncbi:MAG: DNA cytosine methyltransferase [Nitratireductor sp.]|nr:DNA cytosine methyltransferase [Nitratireductor sp.]